MKSRIIFIIPFFTVFTLSCFSQNSFKTRTRVQEYMDSKTPLILDVEYPEDKILSYSFFLRRLNVTGGLISLREDPATQKPVGFRIINLPAINIIGKAFDDHLEIGNNQTNRILFETRDNSRFVEPNPNEVGMDSLNNWKSKYTYCYEIKVPLIKSDRLFDIMKSDIEEFFDVQMTIEKRMRKCLRLIRTDSIDRLHTKSVDSNGTLRYLKNGGVKLKNARMSTLLYVLNQRNGNGKYPIVDATGYNEFIDIEISNNLKDMPSLMNTLRDYGLTFEVSDTNIDMIVVRDVEHPKTLTKANQ